MSALKLLPTPLDTKKTRVKIALNELLRAKNELKVVKNIYFECIAKVEDLEKYYKNIDRECAKIDGRLRVLRPKLEEKKKKTRQTSGKVDVSKMIQAMSKDEKEKLLQELLD